MNEREMLEGTIKNSLERIVEDSAVALEAAGDNDQVFEIVKVLYNARRSLIGLQCDYLKEEMERSKDRRVLDG